MRKGGIQGTEEVQNLHSCPFLHCIIRHLSLINAHGGQNRQALPFMFHPLRVTFIALVLLCAVTSQTSADD